MSDQSAFQFTGANPQGLVGALYLGPQTLVANVVSVIDLKAKSAAGQISTMQSVYIDASIYPGAVRVRDQQTKQGVIFAAGSSGWQPLLIKEPFAIELIGEASGVVQLATATAPLALAPSPSGLVQSAARASVPYAIAAALTDTIIASANARCKGRSFFNDSAGTLYLLNAAGVASSTNFSVEIPPRGYYENPFNYAGEQRGFWSVATGGVRVTEYF